jgi:alpha-glucosidase
MAFCMVILGCIFKIAAMKKYIIIFVVFFLGLSAVRSEEISTKSPDGNIEIVFTLTAAGEPQYKVISNGVTFVNWSRLGLNLKDGGLISGGMAVNNTERKTIDETYPLYSGKSANARNYCNETMVSLQETGGKKRKLDLYFRAYNDGAGFRYALPRQQEINEFIISSEETTFNFAGNYDCWAMKKEKMNHSYEGEYLPYQLNKISGDPADPLKSYPYITLPLTIKASNDLYICLTEAAITDYAGMHLTVNGPASFKGKLSPYPDDNSIAVKGKTPAVTPWRVFVIGQKPGDLVQSNLVLNLNEPSKIPDAAGWIKPGKSLWSWWSLDRGFDPSFGFQMVGSNTTKYYIDFAAANSLDYVLLDAGWYGWLHLEKGYVHHDPKKTLPELDLPATSSYAKSKNIGLILWVQWTDIDKEMDQWLDYFQTLEIKGVKVDFMDRDDQYMVDFYHRLAIACAERKIFVMFHGAYKPDGLTRTYPNLLTYEGVLGTEYAKWSDLPAPQHNATIPFTRMIAGPMDYTPGSMTNSTKEKYAANMTRPMTLGTRAQQLAMIVVYESGIQTLCESPKIYENLPEFEFYRQSPASWDTTIVLDGEIGKYIVVARRKNDTWFIGAMSNWEGRALQVDLGFLGSGKYSAEIYADGPNADVNAEEVSITRTSVTPSETLSLRLAKGGGAGIILRRTQ